MNSFSRKTAKLRDKADLLVAQLYDLSSREDPELQIGLKNLAEDLAMVQDYRQAQVERLETRVVAPLKAYGDIVKNKRRVFQDFITVEMLFHAKALEVYAHTYHNLEAVDIQKDLELFNGRIRMPDTLDGRLDTPLTGYSSPLMSRYPSPPLASPRGQSLRSTLASTTGPNHRQHHSLYPDTVRRARSTLQRQRGMEDDEPEGGEEDEEEDEEEEEEEIYESETEEGQPTSRQSYAAQYAQMRRWQK
ncbi:hypothetical protein FQN60_013920 [Etheostoma spectabile]|uniref:Uncharacterized protein n=1 Tax=Etheostoma spectabile TaxID=54343 RepID=A0A5J5CGG2_9PERO|nr:hypothetical protein FQN60_013920 [Etheostoma spectabile]